MLVLQNNTRLTPKHSTGGVQVLLGLTPRSSFSPVRSEVDFAGSQSSSHVHTQRLRPSRRKRGDDCKRARADEPHDGPLCFHLVSLHYPNLILSDD